MDASGFEGSSIQHDLNQPIPPSLSARFTLVLDSGTLEHVFDVPQALRNCMEIVAPGGHLIAIAPRQQRAPATASTSSASEHGFEVGRGPMGRLARDGLSRGGFHRVSDRGSSGGSAPGPRAGSPGRR
jgi:methyltransferase family protein